MEEVERLMMQETEHYDTAYKVGVENGISLGRNEGRILGRSEGISKRNCEIAKSMLTENIDINLISKITGLSIGQINTLI